MTSSHATALLLAILRLDVFPRLIGVEPSRADRNEALALATDLVASGSDKNLPPILRACAFLPFLHGDTALDLERAAALYAGLRRESGDEIFAAAHDHARRRSEALAITKN
ncbi:MAG: DUF924 family protein [Pseudomonadota bacterium]|uniref:DUF924 family protein n=1 Tax=Sulfuricystis thermophila TaxID=2496847 RepID=UPI001035C608|nr:DUF924 family protein [Sulfuricystis thermophila]MDI6749602.1 DUF924 family protein [Rhodocyclaceae bacterium]